MISQNVDDSWGREDDAVVGMSWGVAWVFCLVAVGVGVLWLRSISDKEKE